MARGRPRGRSKSDHRVCQEARYARAAQYRERIAISAEQQEARIAAVNAECNVEDAPGRRRGQRARELKIKAGAARMSAGGRACKASGSEKKKAKKGLAHSLGKAAERDLHSLHGEACGATAEYGLRGSKEGGSVKYSCRAHATSNGCFQVDRYRAAWAEDREIPDLRAKERSLEEELRNLDGTSFAAKSTSVWNGSQSEGVWADAPSAPPFAAWQKSDSRTDWVSMPQSRSLIATLLLRGGVESNPGPTSQEEKELALKKSWQEVDSDIEPELLDYLAKEALTLARWRGTPDDLRSKRLSDLQQDYPGPGKWLKGWNAIFDKAAGAGPSTFGDPAVGQLQGNSLRISGTGQWSPAIANAIREALDPTFRLLDSQGNLHIPCWTPPPNHPQAAHISRLAILQWRGEPSLLLHALPENEKGRSAADRLTAFIRATRARYGGQQTQLGRATFGLGVSGCGKTRTALEALCGGFGFYLSFSTAEEPGSRVLKAAVERFEGRFQRELTKLLEAGNEEGLKSYRREKLQDAVKLVVRILLVEVLCLERFLECFVPAVATPRKFLMMQLIGLGELEDWLADAWSCVFDVSLEELKKELQRAVDHVKQLSGQDFLLVVVDEAHLGLKSLEGHFPNADNIQGRSLLNAWVRSLDDAAFKGFHFLFTGTRLGIAEHDTLATAIGKGPGVPVIFSDYGINSTSQARSFALEYVPGGDCEEGLWELVAGRYRFAVELTRLRLGNGHVDWKQALQDLREYHTAENEDEGSSQKTLIGRLIALQTSKSYECILESLKGLVTDRYVMGVARPQYRKQVDLVELGFCHLVRAEEDKGGEEGGVKTGKGLWRMDMSEPLAAMVGRVYLERRGRWAQDDEVQQLMLKLDLPSPAGLLWDVYMPTALKDFFNPDKVLGDHPILSSIRHRLPASFFTRPRIICLTKEGTVSDVTDVEAFRVRRGNKGFRLVDFAEDPRGITFFLPEEGAGPDDAHYVQLGDEEPEIWFDILQAKLRPDYELEHALRTVTLDLMYSGHPSREELVVRLKAALKQKGVSGIIRIVAAFPSSKTATTEVFHPEESKTRKEDLCTVQIGVSVENAHQFFREEHLNVLRSLKDVKKRAHSEIE